MGKSSVNKEDGRLPRHLINLRWCRGGRDKQVFTKQHNTSRKERRAEQRLKGKRISLGRASSSAASHSPRAVLAATAPRSSGDSPRDRETFSRGRLQPYTALTGRRWFPVQNQPRWLSCSPLVVPRACSLTQCHLFISF